MLISQNMKYKTYEDWMREALMRIPVYSKEWTNYNSSDPGITMIENLTAFQYLLQQQTGMITDEIREKLLLLAGYEPRSGRCAKVLLEGSGISNPIRMPANQKFYVGEECFETNHMVWLSGSRIIGIFGADENSISNLSNLNDKEAPVCTEIFGRQPKPGQSLYIVMDGMPKQGEELIFYAEMEEKAARTMSTDRTKNEFAQIEWQYYTEQGFEEIIGKDFTDSFLTSGALYFQMPAKAPAYYKQLPMEGYVLKGTLKKADYDMAPRMKNLFGFLFEVWQKETKAVIGSFQLSSGIDMYSDLLEQGHIRVYCREQKGKGYRLYEPAPVTTQEGRFYKADKTGYGSYRFTFHKRKYHYGPARLTNAVKIVAYQEEIMRRYYIGMVMGYDNQEIKLPAENIVADYFSIIAERIDEEGEAYYDFVKPDRKQDGDLTYTLLEREGKIIIWDAGDFIEARLYVGSLSVSDGAEGNVRVYNRFIPVGTDSDLVFSNPCQGEEGCRRETLEETGKRFLRELHQTSVAVTAQDYENLVKITPKLCIHKVKAMMNYQDNTVNIVVKPYGDTAYPQLSQDYRRVIMKHLEKKRLLTTRIMLSGPTYLPIHVSAVIYVEPHYERYREEIEAVLLDKLDYIHTAKAFGAVLRFDEIFRAIEHLDCVAGIEELHLKPQYGNLVEMRGLDIKPQEHCLCCPGQMALTFEACVT